MNDRFLSPLSFDYVSIFDLLDGRPDKRQEAGDEKDHQKIFGSYYFISVTYFKQLPLSPAHVLQTSSWDLVWH